jgi:hypothetical protein
MKKIENRNFLRGEFERCRTIMVPKIVYLLQIKKLFVKLTTNKSYKN